MSYREPPELRARPADHTTYSTWNIEPVGLFKWFAVSFGVTGSFLYTVKKYGHGGSQRGLWKTVTCYLHLNWNQIAGLFSAASLYTLCLWNPLCCLMGSWPQGRGYSLSFLQLAFTVSLAELMHHIFEAQVPCLPLSGCRQDLTDVLYPFQPALLQVIGKTHWRIPIWCVCHIFAQAKIERFNFGIYI